MKEDVEIVRPKEWLEEALITLEKIKAGAKSSKEAVTFYKFVFSNYVVEAFEAILAAKQITVEQAELVNKIMTEYLTDELLAALSDYDQEVIQNLLAPFSEVSAEYASEEEHAESVKLVNPIEWMHEAIETLYRVQRSCKDPIQCAKLKHFTFSTYVAEAFLAIILRKEIFESEVVLVNEIMSKYFDEMVFDLMSSEEKLILENLMKPFAIEQGVDGKNFRLAA
jgi:phenolic acid decarboxylase